MTPTQEALPVARVAVAKALARHPDSSWDDYEWEDMPRHVQMLFLEQADLAIAAIPTPEQPEQDRAVVEALVEALKPFAACCDQIGDDEPDNEWAKFRLTIGDYRRAKAALTATSPAPQELGKDKNDAA